MEKDTEEKRKALDEIWYELWMFNETFKKLPSAYLIENNAYIESFLIHLRNLVFFLENKKFDSDIKISDFNLNEILIDLPVENTLVEINKRLSHLTWDRVRGGRVEWKFKEIKQEINKKVSVFLEKIPDEYFPTFGFKKTKKDFYLLVKNYN